MKLIHILLILATPLCAYTMQSSLHTTKVPLQKSIQKKLHNNLLKKSLLSSFKCHHGNEIIEFYNTLSELPADKKRDATELLEPFQNLHKIVQTCNTILVNNHAENFCKPLTTLFVQTLLAPINNKKIVKKKDIDKISQRLIQNIQSCSNQENLQ